MDAYILIVLILIGFFALLFLLITILKPKDKAIMIDDAGEHVGNKRIKKSSSTFIYDDGIQKRNYTLDRKKAKPITIKHAFGRVKYYIYNVNNPAPLLLDKKQEPLIDTAQLNIILETKVLQDLNKGTGMFANLKPIHIIIGLVVIVALYYFLSGGKLV